jgi:TonB family protein
MGNWSSGNEPSKEDLAVAFYDNGKLLEEYSTLDLVEDKTKVQSSVSHYVWLADQVEARRPGVSPRIPEPHPELDYANKFRLKTCDGISYTFDASTGKIIETQPPLPPPEARLKSPNGREAERTAEIARLLENARQTMEATGTRLDVITEQGGGAQTSYDLAVAKIFEREFQRRPVRYLKNEPPVEVEVVVRRDGSTTGRIIRKSGHAQLDRTVQQVLESTRKVIPFPQHFKSETRTIKISFNLDDG